MICELENLLIDRADFDCIGQVAKHCDWEQLCIYIREQQNLYLTEKLGYCIISKIQNNLTNPEVIKLLCGSEFTTCSGLLKRHYGLKRVLVHASYGTYLYRHGYQDTPFGVVQKLNNDSVPVPIAELKAIKNEQYDNASLYLAGVIEYLCTLKDTELFKDCYCNIGCSTCSTPSEIGIMNNVTIYDNIKCSTCTGVAHDSTQRRQIRFNNISK